MIEDPAAKLEAKRGLYEAPQIRDFGELRAVTLGGKTAPTTPDGAFGAFPIGS